MNQYRRAWGDLRRPLRRAVEEASSASVFLHMPKTGGTSLQSALLGSPSIRFLVLPLSTVSSSGCQCGAKGQCNDHGMRAVLGEPTQEGQSNRPVVIKLNHESYRAVDWVRKAAGRGSVPPTTLLAVRPRRDRLRSVFRDYWTQVGIASGKFSEEKELTPHRVRVVANYARDSLYYLGADGSIDGVAWFSAFREHGTGVAFSLDEVFDGDVVRMQRELDTGALRLVPTKNVGIFIEELTGMPAAPRKRVSKVVGDPAVEAALDDAADLIEELARRDAPFDRVIADHLGDPDFYVE